MKKAAPIVLGNFYRIFNRPQNPEHRGFMDDRMARWLHRLALLAAIVGSLRLWALGSPGLLAPALILSLGAFHAFAWGWPRYAMPVLPTLLAVSGIGLDALGASLPRQWRRWAGLGAILVLIFTLAMLLSDRAPEAAWGIRLAGAVLGLGGVVWLPLRGVEPSPSARATILAIAALSVVVFGNAWRDANWHEIDLPLRQGDVVRQEIRVDPRSLATLRASRERFLAADFELKDRSGRPWDVTINGIAATLSPTLPSLPESIPVPAERRTYPQWWIVPLTDEMLDRTPPSGWVVVDLRIEDPAVARLKADRFRDQSSVFEAPSLGDWPHAAGIKPEYDRDFRLIQTMTLNSLETRTSLSRQGSWTTLRAVARIRMFELDDRTGRASFELRRTGERAGSSAVLGFAARATMRDRGDAELLVQGTPVASFRIATLKDARWTSGPFTLCYKDRTPNRPEAWESRGFYLLSGPIPCLGETCAVEVRFWPGMDDRPMSFGPELLARQPATADLRRSARECSFSDPVAWEFGRLIDGSVNSYPTDRGRWRVARIY
jgi:hypothetical protein